MSVWDGLIIFAVFGLMGVIGVATMPEGQDKVDERVANEYRPVIQRCLKNHDEFKCREYIQIPDRIFFQIVEESQ